MAKYRFHKVESGVWEDPTGMYRVVRDTGTSTCDHPQCDVLHARFLTATGDGRGLVHWVDYPCWDVIEVATGKQVGGGAFETYGEARGYVETYLLP